MNRKNEKIASMALACLTAVGLLTAPLSATAKTSFESDATSAQKSVITESGSYGSTSYYRALSRSYLSTLPVADKRVSAYERISVSVGGTRLPVDGFKANGVEYIHLKSAAEAIGASYTYSSSQKSATVKARGLTLTATSGCYVSYANDRCLFEISPTVLMNDGRLYIPAGIFAKAVGMTVSRSSRSMSISGSYSPILSADRFYREDEVYWLSRIISAESSGEPLLGQIAVGNVVLNRRNSRDYPNTIYGVIFDRKYGVQFSPILNGTIYNTPTYNSVLAAKICLEGYDISSGALFFLEPNISTSSWIPKNRPYLFTIGRHDFYR